MKRIPTRIHGILDYATAAAFIAIPHRFGWGTRSTKLLVNSALFTLLYSIFTRYELGAVKAIPMKGHLTLDAMSGFLLTAAPMMDLDERKEIVASLVGFGLFELAVTMSSETEAPLERTG